MDMVQLEAAADGRAALPSPLVSLPDKIILEIVQSVFDSYIDDLCSGYSEKEDVSEPHLDVTEVKFHNILGRARAHMIEDNGASTSTATDEGCQLPPAHLWRCLRDLGAPFSMDDKGGTRSAPGHSSAGSNTTNTDMEFDERNIEMRKARTLSTSVGSTSSPMVASVEGGSSSKKNRSKYPPKAAKTAAKAERRIQAKSDETLGQGNGDERALGGMRPPSTTGSATVVPSHQSSLPALHPTNVAAGTQVSREDPFVDAHPNALISAPEDVGSREHPLPSQTYMPQQAIPPPAITPRSQLPTKL
ncbi:hypothetical protein CORC01_07859 [Colletotrichum orchidophilum]|uniref:Uncharacterized protein n=1 Tax=Colletotrichum orchidophilum TaxID=1209926 RepID=A0A1G4B6G9_9PEZI|nr:uncharacterized protein CORC01_07859 [Colletotrichum orchidophilum]OHE96892.1 hypothetical protein CORC01_07859 [Colletotrichum orchidophilum]